LKIVVANIAISACVTPANIDFSELCVGVYVIFA